MSIDAVARKITEAAEIEVSAAIDLFSTRPEDRKAARSHRWIDRSLQRIAQTLEARGRLGRHDAFAAIRGQLLPQINRHSLLVLQRALTAFRSAMAARVRYVVDEGDVAEGEAPFDIIPSQLPFIQFHDDALMAAIRIRRMAPDVQWTALQMALSIERVDAFELALGSDDDKASQARLASAKANLVQHTSSLPQGVIDDVRDFYGALEVGSTKAFALPIAPMSDAEPEQLRVVADMYAAIGSELRQWSPARLVGKPAQRLQAQTNWQDYQGCGLSLKVVAGWLRATSMEDDLRICDVCYRHVSAISRCTAHATKTHETREGRLGLRVKPRYLARVKSLAQMPLVQGSVYGSLRPAAEFDDEMTKAADALNLHKDARMRALILGNQLNRLFPVLNPDHYKQAEELFLKLANTASRVFRLPEPRSIDERRSRTVLVDAARELLSLKGFFRAWFGERRLLHFEDEKLPLCFDKDHPVVPPIEQAEMVMTGILDPSLLGRHLLRQYAWELEYEAYKREFMPDEKVIAPLRAKGQGFEQIAADHKVSHQTIRANLVRPNEERRRNRLGH